MRRCCRKRCGFPVSAAIDVSSGVETRPGMKNIAKIREFLALAGAL